MEKIQMVDLGGQYRKIKAEIDSAISEVVNGSLFISGSHVKIIEDELALYTGAKHCITCANGTDALKIAMMAMEINAGDEIIMPSFTFIAAAEAAALLKIKPVFVDCLHDSFNINVSRVEAAITSKTKAIIPVHLFGQCADLENLLKISHKYNIPIIEDTAQALGAQYYFSDKSTKKAGTIGTIGITSFFPSKNLGCYGDGGALFTNDEKLSERIRMITNHGQKKKYFHDSIGLNSRLDTIQAAILNVKLKKLNAYSDARINAAKYYDNTLGSIPDLAIPYCDQKSSHVYNQYTLTIKNGARDNLKIFLESKSIPYMIYYPIPAHLQKAYEYLGYKKGDLPTTESLCKKVISLPMHTELTDDQLSYICENILNFFKK